MAIWEYKGEYFYGPKYKEKYESREGSIGLRSYLRDKAKRYGLEAEGPFERDPDGEVLPYWWIKWDVPLREVGSLSLPKRYPGDYYWIWHNGAFFKVLGETERYVLVDVLGAEHADALGIPREMVQGEYPDKLGLTRWWLKKSEIRMPDELGVGRYIYLKLGYFFKKVCEVVKRDGTQLRVRMRIKAYSESMLRTRYEEIMNAIKRGVYPWDVSYKMIKEIADMAEGEAWIERDVMYCEASLDLEVLKKYKGKRDKYGGIISDYYWYGEEEVPYRL